MSKKHVITDLMPNDWRDLQAQVGRILQECGFTVDIDKTIETVRGTVNIDVYSEDSTRKPTTIYVCECKHWASAVPKTIIHAFRTVVSDFGANWGLVVSSKGFQKGAFEVTVNSNVRLLNWTEFQELFVDRWIERYLVPRICEEADPLIEYTEPINSRIFRKATALSAELREEFGKLRDQYRVLGYFASHLCFILTFSNGRIPELPLKTGLKPEHIHFKGGLPVDLLEATSLRQFLDVMCNYVQTGVAAFDKVFGERA